MSENLNLEHSENQCLSKQDFVFGTIIASVLLFAFTLVSPGMSLIATFVPGVIFAWVIFAGFYFKKIDLPSFKSFLPLFLLTLGWQFLHFTEEFVMNFKGLFPIIYGGLPFSNNVFVAFNMAAYFVFIVSTVLFYFRRLRFLFMPMLFFVVYGALGNTISHSWWSIYFGEYFPGLYSALLYWILAPILLFMIFKSRKLTATFIGAFTVTLLLTLTLLLK